MNEEAALIIENNSNWDTSTISEIQFQICTKHQEEAKAFCKTCNSLLCVFCMIPDEADDSNHIHSAVNAKTYVNQGRNKWKELHAKSVVLDIQYDKKIEELGHLCSSMFKNMSGGNGNISNEGLAQIDEQMAQNKEKVDVLKKFVKDVAIYLEKAEAFESENRADLMTMLNSKLMEYTKKMEALQKVLSEMTIQKVIEESFEDKGNREYEQSILVEEGNQKSVNAYLIQKIHTLEDRVNVKFDKEQDMIKQLNLKNDKDLEKVEQVIKEKELKSEKQYREMKQQIGEIKSLLTEWSNYTIFQRMIFELQIYGKVALDARFSERVRKEKLSEHCIYCIARMPDGKIVIDANKRATILDDTTFEVVAQLDPNDSQLISVGF